MGVIISLVHFNSWGDFYPNILYPMYWPFWFFKGLFSVQLIAYLSLRIIGANRGQGSMVAFAAIISLFVYVVPYMGVARVMMPMFWIGYLMKIYYEEYLQYRRVIGVIAMIIFIGLYRFWNTDTMHYSATASVSLYHIIYGMHGYTITNLIMLGYRIILGMAGSMLIISAMHELNSVNRYVCSIGEATAGIYIAKFHFRKRSGIFL